MTSLRNLQRANAFVEIGGGIAVGSTATILAATGKSLETEIIGSIFTLGEMIGGYGILKGLYNILHGISHIKIAQDKKMTLYGSDIILSENNIKKFKYLGSMSLILGAWNIEGGLETICGVNLLGEIGFCSASLAILPRLTINTLRETFVAFQIYKDQLSDSSSGQFERNICCNQLLQKGCETFGWGLLTFLGISNPIGWVFLGLALVLRSYNEVQNHHLTKMRELQATLNYNNGESSPSARPSPRASSIHLFHAAEKRGPAASSVAYAVPVTDNQP